MALLRVVCVRAWCGCMLLRAVVELFMSGAKWYCALLGVVAFLRNILLVCVVVCFFVLLCVVALMCAVVR